MLFFIPIVLFSCVSSIEEKHLEYSNDSEAKSSNSYRKNTITPFNNFNVSKDYFEKIRGLKISTKQKEELIHNISQHFDFYINNEFEKTPLIERFKFIELNNDGQPDLIYFGPSGSEGKMVSIFLSNKNKYKPPINFYQYLAEMNIIDGQLKSLRIIDPGCCAEYIQKEYQYTFNKDMQPIITHTRCRIFDQIDETYTILEEPIHFVIESEYNRLRGKPTIDDSSQFVYDNRDSGNTIAIFGKGHKGKAWVIDRSDPERDWWYVEMEPTNDQLQMDLFSHLEDKKIHRLGWMSNKYLRITSKNTNIKTTKNHDFISWLNKRFPDSIKIDYSYGYATYNINHYIELDKKKALVIVTWDDALCHEDSAYVFSNGEIVSKMNIGSICDNPEPDLGYQFSEYSIDNKVIKTTLYKEYLPDSIEKKVLKGEEIDSWNYKIYDTIVNYYKVSEDDKFKKTTDL